MAASLLISDVEINALVSFFVWPFARILGMMLAEPIFSSRSIPRRFKGGFALMLTVVVAPLLPPMPEVPLVSAAGVAILLNQLLIGIMIGFVMRLVMTVVEMAGMIASAQMGLGFAMFFDPQHSASVPALSRLLSMFVTLLYLAFNGPQIVLSVLLDSFSTLPVGVSVPADSLQALANWGGHIFSWGLWLSLPVVAALLVTNLAIGVMTRAAPQFNIFAFGFPLTLMIGFVALYLAVPLMVPALETVYRESFEFVRAILFKLPAP
ncbi:flagellar biosynthetic protein FliR [Craterilacuibacter sp.]|uniref:flagellar biosynthetic protein FliR n=1 Tax=Craterilacuibacter sp. TaxID=2870909 RepID=UPI003F3D9C49